MSWLKKIAEPEVLLPVLLSASALAAAFSISNAGQVWESILRITVPIMAIVLGFAFVYVITKWVQFHYFLMKSQIPATPRQSALAFVIGEMANPVPAGVYIENYVLGQIYGYQGARSAGATTAILFSEILVCFFGLLILLVPGWWWLRPAIGMLLVLSFLVVAAFVLIKPLQDLGNRVLEMGPIKKVHQGLLDALQGIQDLFTLDVAIRALPMTAVYLAALVAAFMLVAHAVGVDSLTYPQAVSIYIFSLAVTELLPISADLGVIELSGVGAAQAWGYSYSEGLAMMLGLRLVWTGSIWLIGAVTLLLLRDEFARGRREQRRERQGRREMRERHAGPGRRDRAA